jgi:hypothetical protein
MRARSRDALKEIGNWCEARIYVCFTLHGRAVSGAFDPNLPLPDCGATFGTPPRVCKEPTAEAGGLRRIEPVKRVVYGPPWRDAPATVGSSSCKRCSLVAEAHAETLFQTRWT